MNIELAIGKKIQNSGEKKEKILKTPNNNKKPPKQNKNKQKARVKQKNPNVIGKKNYISNYEI